jgi:hypothetical protein
VTDPALFGPLARLVKYNPGAATDTIPGREVDVLGANDSKAKPKVRSMTLCLAYDDELTRTRALLRPGPGSAVRTRHGALRHHQPGLAGALASQEVPAARR